MIRIAIMLMWILFPLIPVAHGAPFLVSDPPESAVESCAFDGLDLSCTLAPDGSIHADLAALPAGSHAVKAKYCTEKGLWCSEWSRPFVFTKPALPPPAAISLSR